MGTILKNGINYSGSGSGSSGGVSSYNELTDKPSIANVTLSGNKSASDLGLQTATLGNSIQIGNTSYTTVETALTALKDLGAPIRLDSVSSSETWGYSKSLAGQAVTYWVTDSGGNTYNLPYDSKSGRKDYCITLTANATRTVVSAVCYAIYYENNVSYIDQFIKNCSGNSDGTGWSTGTWLGVGALKSNTYTPDDTAETTIADDDYFPFYDTSASGKRKSLWSNIKSVLKTYFDSKYQSALTCLDSSIYLSSGLISSKMAAFSTSETSVGQWTNGATVYQKTISLGAFPNNGTKSVAHGISGNFTIIQSQGFVTGLSGSNYQQYEFPFVNTTGLAGYVYRNGSNLVMVTNFDGSGFRGWITIRYVKSNL